MPLSPQWEYLTVQLKGQADYKLSVLLMNDQPVDKNIPLHSLISQLGAASWEMTGAISTYGWQCHCIFFKRLKP